MDDPLSALPLPPYTNQVKQRHSARDVGRSASATAVLSRFR